MIAEDADGEPPAGLEPVPDADTLEAASGAGWRAGRSYREIAVYLFGADHVDAEWHRDGWMRARVRRLLRRPRIPVRDKARAAVKHGPRGG